MSEINYKAYNVTQLFTPHQGNAIYTKKAVISNGWEGDIPVISSDTSNDGVLCHVSRKYVQDKDYIDFPCITWTVDGQAGTLVSRNEPFVPNNHCGYLIPTIENLYLPYFVLAMQPQFYKCAKNSANKKVGNNQIEKLVVKVPVDSTNTPDLDEQKRLAKIYIEINEQKEVLLNKVSELQEISVRLPKDSNVLWKEVLVTDLFNPKGGNTSYSKTWANSHPGNYPLYSGTTSGIYDSVSIADYNGEYLSWCIDGLAGFIMYHNEAFSVTCHRGVLEPRTDVDFSNISLKYLKYVFEPVFRKRKKGREGDLGKNEYTSLKPIAIKKMKDTFPVPITKDGNYDLNAQLQLAEKYEQIDTIKASLINRITELTDIIVI